MNLDQQELIGFIALYVNGNNRISSYDEVCFDLKYTFSKKQFFLLSRVQAKMKMKKYLNKKNQLKY